MRQDCREIKTVLNYAVLAAGVLARKIPINLEALAARGTATNFPVSFRALAARVLPSKKQYILVVLAAGVLPRNFRIFGGTGGRGSSAGVSCNLAVLAAVVLTLNYWVNVAVLAVAVPPLTY